MLVNKREAAFLADALVAFNLGKPLQYRNVHSDGSVSEWFDYDASAGFVINTNIEYRNKPELKHRPFNSADEFRPHRDRWVIRKDKGNTAYGCVHHYSDSHVAFNVDESTYNVEWSIAFEKLLFEDGAPFGVQCKE